MNPIKFVISSAPLIFELVVTESDMSQNLIFVDCASSSYVTLKIEYRRLLQTFFTLWFSISFIFLILKIECQFVILVDFFYQSHFQFYFHDFTSLGLVTPFRKFAWLAFYFTKILGLMVISTHTAQQATQLYQAFVKDMN